MRVKIYNGSPAEIAEYEQLMEAKREKSKVRKQEKLHLEMHNMPIKRGVEFQYEPAKEQPLKDEETYEPMESVKKPFKYRVSRRVGGRSCKKWSHSERETLRVLTMQNLHYSKIAKILGRSTTAIKMQQKYLPADLDMPVAKKERKKMVLPERERKRRHYTITQANYYLGKGLTRKDAWQKAADEWKIIQLKERNNENTA